MEKKKNVGLIITIIILVVALFGTSGYIVYDKFFSNDKVRETKEEDNSTVDEENNESKKNTIPVEEDEYFQEFLKTFETYNTDYNINNVDDSFFSWFVFYDLRVNYNLFSWISEQDENGWYNYTISNATVNYILYKYFNIVDKTLNENNEFFKWNLKDNIYTLSILPTSYDDYNSKFKSVTYYENYVEVLYDIFAPYVDTNIGTKTITLKYDENKEKFYITKVKSNITDDEWK